jgi:2-haloacid dehalogenase
MLNFNDFEVLTFDCYGTLIDWDDGIWGALQPILKKYHRDLTGDQALELYAELEASAERGEYHPYREVLRMVLEKMGERLGFTLSQDELGQFSTSVKDWPAFPDSPRALQALKKKYKLAILSNVDDDLFAYSAQRLGVEFDWVITAQQLRSYKPSLANFRGAIERIGLPKEKILHVAQSLFHDIAPAREMGLSTVWINRRQDKEGFGATPPAHAQPDLEFPDLISLANQMGLI